MSESSVCISYTEMAQRAVEDFKNAHNPYYGTLPFSSRYLEQKIQQTMGAVKQSIGPRAYRRIVKQLEGNFRSGTVTAEMSDKTQAIALMESYKKAYYTVAAEATLKRFEQAKGYGRPEAVDEQVKEIDLLYRRAGIRNWSIKKRDEVQERIDNAATTNHRASEEMARTALSNMGSGYHTYRDFDRVVEKIEYHAEQAGGGLGPFKRKALDREVAKRAMEAVTSRLEIYATAPRCFGMTTAEREKEERDIHNLYCFYGSHAPKAPSIHSFMSAMDMARTASIARAERAQKEDKPQQSPAPELPGSNVVPLFSAPRCGEGKPCPENMQGRIPDSVPNPYASAPARDKRTDRAVQMAAGTFRDRNCQAQ